MLSKTVSGLVLILVLTGMLTLAFNVQPASSEWTGTVYIRADGSIDPPDAPIIAYDNVTYTLTDDIASSADGIVVERDNIILDGANYILNGTREHPYNGVDLSHRYNVTIKNMNIKNFDRGILLDSSLNNKIIGNNITATNSYGIMLHESLNNTIYKNNITATTWWGIRLDVSSNHNNITANNIVDNYWGIILSYSCNYNTVRDNNVTANDDVGIGLGYLNSYNSIIGNNVIDNGYAIHLIGSSHNIFYHNNFKDNIQQVYVDHTYPYPSINLWDDGYPSGGNYWSDYTGVDANGDGIGDTPYVIDADNQDRYPLMHPWSPLSVHNINTGLGYKTIQEAINAPETMDGHTIFVEAGTYYEDIVVNKSLIILGENKDITIVSPSYTAFSIKSNNVQISGFTMQGASNGVLSNAQNVTINNNLIINCENSGIQIATTSNTISSNFIANCGTAILIYGSNHIIEQNVVMTNKFFSIQLSYFSNNNKVRANVIVNNDNTGIYVQSSDNNTISANEIINNGEGIRIAYSTGNLIFHNNIINNTRQVFIDRGNTNTTWDNGYPSGGNYWSDYVGVDVKNGSNQDLPGSDGIGDTPYVIDADNVDHYPLMFPFGAPPPPTYNLTIIATVGGTTHPPPGTYSYTENSTVEVTAIPDSGYLFDYWELDGAIIGSANPLSVNINRDIILTAVFTTIPPPLSASISPMSMSLIVGEPVTFTSTTTGGYPPYGYQWYLNGNPVSGATSDTWTFTPTEGGIFYIYLKVTDAEGNTAQSDTARVAVAAVPVGGYSYPINKYTLSTPIATHIALTAILTAIFTTIKRKTKRKH